MLYHGTTPSEAQVLFSKKVRLSYGGGEFGKGLYVGRRRRLAKRRAYHKTKNEHGNASDAMNYRNNTFVIEFDTQLFSNYYKRKFLCKINAISLFKSLAKKPQTTASYVVNPNFDYIVGPVVGGRKRYLDIEQYKFDSPKSEAFLNGHCAHIKLNSSVI